MELLLKESFPFMAAQKEPSLILRDYMIHEVLDNEELSSRKVAIAAFLNHKFEQIQQELCSTSFWNCWFTTLDDGCPDSG